MMSKQQHIIEMDGALYGLHGNQLKPITDLSSVQGNKHVATDLQEAMSRLMTVEAPPRFAEMLVRRKLQENGEYEEPVTIINHWIKKQNKNTTNIFFTALPQRLARFYFDEPGQQNDILLVYPMYTILWDIIQRSRSKKPLAVVLRHDRYAEVLVGSKDTVYMADRCVAFDTEAEQIQALWETVVTMIETAQTENRFQIDGILYLNWIDAQEDPPLPQQWQDKLQVINSKAYTVGEQSLRASWPLGVSRLRAQRSVSRIKEKAAFYAQKWSTFANAALLTAAVLLAAGLMFQKNLSQRTAEEIQTVDLQIREIEKTPPITIDVARLDKQIAFIEQIKDWRVSPSTRQLLDDLSLAAFRDMQLKRLKIDFTPQHIQMDLYGDIDAPFDQAHSGYQIFLRGLEQAGYRLEEHQFETRIDTSRITLKLQRVIS